MLSSAEEVLRFIAEENVEFVDVRFCDLPGTMQHFTVPASSFGDSVFTDGLMFDGSSIRGFQQIHESDMQLLPDPSTAMVDPFRARKTVNLTFFVHDPLTGAPYSRDPRNVARKAEDYLRGTGIGDTAYFGPEAEFYIFDSARFSTSANEGYYHIDSVEGAWNTGKDEVGGNLAYKPRYKGGYFPVPPMDHYTDLRSEMVRNLIASGIEVEMQHHEVGTAGQAEIDIRFRPLLAMADALMTYKYVVKSTARAAGKTVTFMPKPLFGDNGNGMHCHQSLWKDCRTPAGTTSAACSSMPPRCWPSPTRPPTPTTGWSPASRHRSTSSTRSATAQPAPGSRSPAQTRRPSGSSSGCRTRRPTRTWRSPRC